MTQITRTCVECWGSGFTGQQWPEYGMTDDGRHILLGMNRVICPHCTDGKQSGWKKCPDFISYDRESFACLNHEHDCDCKDGLIPATDINDVEIWRK